ncbi:hypothetical protein [Elioraea sp.]|uniref:hypothetical protein n=1 Tax=Elioraea sp. TaxID=2185103 RepID=UPI0025BFF4B2|nr:hypothetical protein [Elioraea sp.]
MSGETFVLLNLLLVKGPILGLALWELWKLRHYPKPPERQESVPSPLAPMGGDRKDLPSKPLPDCLVPRPLALPARRREERVRELEPV